MKKILYLYICISTIWIPSDKGIDNSWEIDEQTASYILSCMAELRQEMSSCINEWMCGIVILLLVLFLSSVTFLHFKLKSREKESEKASCLQQTYHEIQALEQIPFIHRLHTLPCYLNEKELKEAEHITDDLFDNFTHRLKLEIPSLTDQDIQFCCLLKLRFSIAEIAVFLNIDPTSVSRRKLRIKNKIFTAWPNENNHVSLDQWLSAF